ncbi:MAG TPA: aldo/keto reductase [Acidimicrobiales bacterium]|nr:aldo/keto reductase [Acidimicrobiales bacterium]
MQDLQRRRLGACGIEVSTLALGSWRTYERVGREQGISVMRAARERGVTFLDDARYDDESGKAPMRTGYSEVLFGELFRAAGWERDEVVVANKLWWEFWPDQTAAQELDASLGRMGFDYIDLAYSWAAPGGPPVETVVTSVGALISSGKLRAWGTGNWPPEDHERAAKIAMERGLPPPCAAQLPYNLGLRHHVEPEAALRALDKSGAAVVASFVLHGGVLSGKYAKHPASGRMADELAEPEVQRALAAADDLRTLAARLGATPAALAIAFALANERVAAVLFGATTSAQVAENVRSLEVLDRLDAAALTELRAIGA